ncbi:hypothetical protein D0A40_20490 [Xanthomonas campestris pv. raphani]|nr:hypothetical protein D0A40_20490 [Xanthomonas campestris pv. raphani]
MKLSCEMSYKTIEVEPYRFHRIWRRVLVFDIRNVFYVRIRRLVVLQALGRNLGKLYGIEAWIRLILPEHDLAKNLKVFLW